MNRLEPAGADDYRLPAHAHIVAYEGSRPLLTIYRCGAAQEPPVAQLIGTLDRVDAAHETVDQPTGRIVKLREPATLRGLEHRRWAVATAD